MQLLSSLDPLEHSASLSLGGSTGEQGNCLGHSRLRSLSVSMESLDFGLAHLWCLCVLGQGQGHPAAGPVAGVACGVVVCSLGALRQPRSPPRLCASEVWSGHSDPGGSGSSAGALTAGQPERGGEGFGLLWARALPLWV